MNNFLKTILHFFVIWGTEIFLVWLVINYFFPLETEQFLDSGQSDNSSLINSLNRETIQVTFKDRQHPFANLPMLVTETTQDLVIATLGQPTSQKPGYWDNSVAWSYENVPSPGIDLGFLFDINSQRLRQAEIAVPPNIKLESLYNIADSLLEFTPAKIEQKLAAVYWRKTNLQRFEIDNLEAVIQRNDRDRIYIGIWEQDFH